MITGIPRQLGDTFTSSLQSVEAQAGDTIVRQGTPADKFFIIVEGEAEVLRDGQAVEKLSSGQLFGEVAIMRESPRSASVRATTDVKLLALERDSFRDLIAQSMEITPDFDRVIRARLDAQETH